jgi:hypothetical protein
MSGPIARPIALQAATENGWTSAPSGGLRAATDLPSGFSSRISPRQLDAIGSELTDDDLAVVQFISEVRLATGHQIARRLWSAAHPRDVRARAARRALRRLEDWRVLDRLARRVGGMRGGSTTIVYCLGPVGRRLLIRRGFTAKRLTAPGDRFVRHTLAITELCVRLAEADIGGDIDLIELQNEPRCWRPFLGLMGARLILKPDLFTRVGAGALEDRWFIEIDLATESLPTIANKAKLYLSHYRSGEEQRRHGVYPRVIWAVPDKRRASQIATALRGLGEEAQRLFSIWLYDETVGRLAAEAVS